MHDSLMNEFVLDSATKSSTDWVVTMPTKRHYVTGGTGLASKLFQRNFNGGMGSCDDLYLINVIDREERPVSPPPSGITTPPASTSYSFCWGANIFTFNNSSVLGSGNGLADGSGPIGGYPVAPTFQDGWMRLNFPTNIFPDALANVHELINIRATTISGKGQMTTGNTATYYGLPAIGFAVVSFTNGTLQIGTPPVNVLSNYGGNFVHKTSTTIQ
jgi:hypothetical protein